MIGARHTAAVEAVAAGFHVFPVRPGAKTPAVRDWERAATRDLAAVERWWRARPFNIGLAVGRSRVVVLDLDRARPGETAPPDLAGCRSGRDVLDRLAAEHGGPVPATRTVCTPSGGVHLYFAMPAGVGLRNSQGRLGWKIDTRGHGGYVVAAGSVCPSGRYVVDPAPIAALPRWIADLLVPPDPMTSAASTTVLRPGAAVTRYVRAIVAAECAELAAAPGGQRHIARLRAARTLGRIVAGGALELASARAALLTAAQAHLGLDTTRREVERDIDDGLAFGARRPRRITRR